MFVNNAYEFEEMELEKKGKEPISVKGYWIGRYVVTGLH